ncbi:Predicted inosine-uridine preferring nucleoside hydrolase [Phaffia rhodozyma]|uniref:Predicted inosine-uridine preferring nucleoside hydrolase n=1 Tax=Phaffia rhodozyma TaxID=264483 RepID=A0A0F7SPX2_PHARH|nr:Predicted inosine-uridine preferring nucleoside hydrolase [Phaffia rhodozyma]
MVKNIWLDCDPGHDDAVALLLALNLSEINLLGVSSVNGNSGLENTTRNAATLLAMFKAREDMPLERGAKEPIAGPEFNEGAAEAIHGSSGLDGVELLPPLSDPRVQHFYSKAPAGTDTAVQGMARAIRDSWKDGQGEKVWIVVTGPCTNAARLIKMEEDLVKDAVAGWVVMGGSFDIPQWTPVAEFNIHTDPAALSEILRPAPFPPVILDPLNITHSAIFTSDIHQRLLDPKGKNGSDWRKRGESDVRWMLSTLLTFFADTYLKVFDFKDGPPIHDALCVAWLGDPSLFKGRWCDLEVGSIDEGSAGRGQTRLVKGTEWRNGSFEHGVLGNCFVLETLDTSTFWNMFLECVDKVEKKIQA